MPSKRTRRRQAVDETLQQAGNTLFNLGSFLELDLPLSSPSNITDLQQSCDDDDIEILKISGSSLQAVGAAMANPFWGRGKRGEYMQISKSRDFFQCSLQWPDRWFRHRYRMGSSMFYRLVRLLETDPVFQTTGNKPQRPVSDQLACFLWRYGSLGSDVLTTAQNLSLSVGSVCNYSRRVIAALRHLRNRFLSWPNPDRKDLISASIEERSGFRNCLGAGDGSLIRLLAMPTEHGALYLCRKKFAAINVQMTVDHQRRFTSFEMGWPGSVSDMTIWKNSDLWAQCKDYFRPGEYILVDKGYPTTPYSIRPFSEPEIEAAALPLRKRMRAFNKTLSGIRIEVEHTLGLLKGRFPSLKGLGAHRDIQNVYRTIEALMTIHNICIDFGDIPEYIPMFDGTDTVTTVERESLGDVDIIGERVEGNSAVPGHETDVWLLTRGREIRMQMLDELIPDDF